MERGVVVGGLMICGSFLLAASLNRSAVRETALDEPKPVACVAEAQRESGMTDESGADEPEIDDPGRGDLPGNGRERCKR